MLVMTRENWELAAIVVIEGVHLALVLGRCSNWIVWLGDVCS
jgi:hypothetical protein